MRASGALRGSRTIAVIVLVELLSAFVHAMLDPALLYPGDTLRVEQ